MNGKKCLLIGLVVSFIFTVALLMGNPDISKAQEQKEKCHIVTIQSRAGINPEALRVKKGDCVVWINRTRGEDVKVIFEEGNKCADMTKSAVGFKLDYSGCYVTDYLMFGETSSLLFAEPGTFRYKVDFMEIGGGGSLGVGKRIGTATSGTIIVE